MKEEVEDISVEEVNVTSYTRLSPRVKTLFQQYRYDVDNFHRRNRVYRVISGLLTYYPSGEDVNWMLTNQDNRPTKEVGVEDLFEMFEILVFQIVIENTWDMLQTPGFMESCEKWRRRDRSDGKYPATIFRRITLFQLWDDAAQCFNELEYSNLAPGHDTVQAPVALGDPHLGVLIYPGQLIDADLVRDGASASGYHRRLMDFFFCFYGFPLPVVTGQGPPERYTPHSVVAARTARTLAMAAPVPVLRGDITLVGCSLMEVWKKCFVSINNTEDEDAAAEREEYGEEWAMFEEDMAYLAHLERIMDAEDSSEDEVEEARRLFSSHGRRNIICPVVTDARCRASLESSVVSKDEFEVSAELIVSQDRYFASTHVLYVDKHRSCTCVNDTECDHTIPVYECKAGVKPAAPMLCCGHNLCFGCLKRVVECPLCKGPPTRVGPNIAVRNLTSNQTAKCESRQGDCGGCPSVPGWACPAHTQGATSLSTGKPCRNTGTDGA
ncbi:hypothetical protein Bbelb_318210 [Branchiostoma belcheri]|nr:hypothetical protein Bbelb_318210 [Branchiostoma belcheri]